MATRADIHHAKTDIMQATRVAVAEAVNPLKTDMRELRERVAKLEIGGVGGVSPKPWKKVLNLLNSADCANQRLPFIGFGESVVADARVEAIEAIFG